MGENDRPVIPRLHLITNRQLCPPGAQATAAQLQERIDTIRRWAKERRPTRGR